MLNTNVVRSTKETNTIPLMMKNNIKSGSALEALPKQFVSSMKTLFDILDDQQTGFVRFSDIQKGWQEDDAKGLPRGVIEALHKVTPASGLLSFERFCTGLKLCLLRNQSDNIVRKSSTTTTSPIKMTLNSRSPSVPLMHIHNAQQNNNNNNNNKINMSSNNMLHAQRTLSLPQLSPNSDTGEIATSMLTPSPPPKPPRAAATTALLNKNTTANVTKNSTNINIEANKSEIRHALQNWQMGILLNEINKDVGYRGSADGGSSSATDSGTVNNDMAVKKSGNKRREPRRHTLQNGMDYNLLKRRLKQFEEERELLLLGLETVEKAREWYALQLNNVQEKIKYLGRMGSHVEQWSEVQQERLNFQRARVLDINRNLQTLTDFWERGDFPMHFNLASSSGKNMTATGERLRQQNHLLTTEVNFKSERISLLEREKQMLMYELYELHQQRLPHMTTNGAYLSIMGQTSPGCSSTGALGDADVVY